MLCLLMCLARVASRTIEWNDSWTGASWRVATEWARNESVSMRHRHNGVLSLCPRPEDIVRERSPANAKQTPTRQRIAWFMSIAKPSDQVSRTYSEFAKAATTSAILNAPSLAPYFVYTFLPDESFEDPDDDLAVWLRRAGTRVVKWRLSFWDSIPERVRSSKQGHINVGAFGRLDVPLIVANHLAQELTDRGISRDFVLYTDADVMFARDWPARPNLVKCADCKRGWPHPNCCRKALGHDDPKVFMAGTEVFAIWALNSGVMLMNVQRWLSDRQNLLKFANEKAWNFMMYDQGLLESFYKQNGTRAWDSFDDALYNSRGFMKFASLATRPDAQTPYVWHWHGFKPYDVKCWLEVLIEGDWNLKGDVRTQISRSKSHGCRGLLNTRMSFPDCSLALYLELYANYLRLLLVADNLAASGSPFENGTLHTT